MRSLSQILVLFLGDRTTIPIGENTTVSDVLRAACAYRPELSFHEVNIYDAGVLGPDGKLAIQPRIWFGEAHVRRLLLLMTMKERREPCGAW